MFLRLQRDPKFAASVRPKMTLLGPSAARRELCEIQLHPCLAEGSPGKVHLIHSDQEAAENFFFPAVNDCKSRDLLAFALHRELQGEKAGPAEGAGRARGMV